MSTEVQPVEERLIEEEMKEAYLTYAMSVIVARALPDVRDGLKPVQRRVLVAMNELNLGPRSKTRKCGKIVGDVAGNYHPHGEVAIYDTLVRMGQPFTLRYPLVDGQGNFGSLDGDPPAAMRYTEARLSAVGAEMLADLDQDTVDLDRQLRQHARRALRPALAHTQPAGQRRQRHRRRHVHQHPAAQPARAVRRHDARCWTTRTSPSARSWTSCPGRTSPTAASSAASRASTRATPPAGAA